MLYQHELSSGRVRVFGPGAPSQQTAGGVDDGFLPPAAAASSSSWASLDFLYVEHAALSYQAAREEAGKRALAQAVAASAGAPLSLGEIKRKEAEKKKNKAMAGAGPAGEEGEGEGEEGAAVALAPEVQGMGMEGSGGGDGQSGGGQGHRRLAALVPRGMATLNLTVAWSVAGEDPGGQRGQAGRRVGQHQVLSHAVRPLTLDPTTAAPLTITVQYPPLVAGRLGPCGLLQKCEAEVLVTVHNRMTDMGVDFVFEALTTPSGKRQSANRAAASPSFVWCAPCRAVLVVGGRVHMYAHGESFALAPISKTNKPTNQTNKHTPTGLAAPRAPSRGSGPGPASSCPSARPSSAPACTT